MADFLHPCPVFPAEQIRILLFSPPFTASVQSGKVQVRTAIDKLLSVRAPGLTSSRLRSFRSETGRED